MQYASSLGKLQIQEEKWAWQSSIPVFFDICEVIWGGSKATEQIPSGVESIDIEDVMTSSTSTTDTISTQGSLNSSIDEDDQTPSKSSGTVD